MTHPRWVFVLAFEAFIWMMSVLTTMLTWMEIKIVIFHMANSVTMLAFHNIFCMKNTNKWIWIVMNKSNTMKLNRHKVVSNIKWQYFSYSIAVMFMLLRSSYQGLIMGFGSVNWIFASLCTFSPKICTESEPTSISLILLLYESWWDSVSN